MCQFNFLVTKEKSNYSEIKEIAFEYGLNYSKYKLNLPNFAELRTFLTTTEHCDCGSVLGKKYSDDSSEPDPTIFQVCNLKVPAFEVSRLPLPAVL